MILSLSLSGSCKTLHRLNGFCLKVSQFRVLCEKKARNTPFRVGDDDDEIESSEIVEAA